MKQSRKMSLAEALTNTAIGYLVALLTQLIAFPLFGLEASLGQNLGIGLVFTGVSIVRSYILRRAFEAFRPKR
jgi:hypothetical protein